MSFRNLVAVAAAALLLTSGVASAATHHRAMRMPHKPMHHGTMSRSGGASSTAAGPDHSADQLNAQQLQRTQGQ